MPQNAIQGHWDEGKASVMIGGAALERNEVDNCMSTIQSYSRG